MSMSDHITDIKYGPLRKNRGTVQFTYNGHICTITEPKDVLLVGTDDRKAATWIAENYEFLLAFLQPKDQ